jgi:hypothetical protein
MIIVTENDIGRRVIYRPRVGDAESGVITSIGMAGIFVQYDTGTGVKLTHAYDLTWEEPTDDQRK